LFQPTLLPAPKNSEISGWQSGAPDLGRKLALSVTLLGTVTRLSFGTASLTGVGNLSILAVGAQTCEAQE
jgi:hypothetical protein